LQQLSEAQEHHTDKNTIIVIMENMVKEALKKRGFSEYPATLTKAAVIVQNDIFNHHFVEFIGSFLPNCQEDALSHFFH